MLSPRRSLLASAAAGFALSLSLSMSACSQAGGSAPSPPATSSSAPQALPSAPGVLSDPQAKVVFERAAQSLRDQRTTAVTLGYQRVDGQPVRQILNPTVRLDLRNPDKPVASLSLSILAANVAVDGKVYRQQPDATGDSTVWVTDPEARTPIEFVLFKPGAANSRVAYLGVEQIAGRQAHRYRVYDPQAYSGPTVGPVPSPPPPSSGTSSAPAGASPSVSPSVSATGAPSSLPRASAGVGDYDEFWFADDGLLVRMSSVLGQLRLTSNKIEYGGDLHIDVPDVSKAISTQEYESRRTAPSPAPSR